MEPKIILEAKDFVAVNKPAGLLVHSVPGKEGAEPTLVDWLLEKFPEIAKVGDEPKTRPGIVHRLDKTTSGVMLIPLTQDYFEYLKKLFQNAEIKKSYLAVVKGFLKNKKGRIDSPIGMKRGSLKRSTKGTRLLKNAVTEYEVLEEFEIEGEKLSLLKVLPKTGRTHQIRVHLASIGHGVLGDVLYGSKKNPTWVIGVMLHAFSLEWSSKEGKRFKVEAEVPRDWLSKLSTFVKNPILYD